MKRVKKFKRIKFTLYRTRKCVACNRLAICWHGHVHQNGKSGVIVSAGWCIKHEPILQYDLKSCGYYLLPRKKITPIKYCLCPMSCYGYNKRRYGYSKFTNSITLSSTRLKRKKKK